MDAGKEWTESSRTQVGGGGSQQQKASQDAFVDARAGNEYVRICLATLLFSITQNYSALLVIVFQHSGRTIPQIGVLISSFAAPVLVGTLMSSVICARLGVLRAIRSAIIFTMLGLGSLAFTRHSYALALVSRLVQGAGVGLLLPTGLVYVQSRIRPLRYIYYVSIFSAMIPVATSIAPPLGSLTLRTFGATTMFLSATLWCLIALALTIGLRAPEFPKDQKGLGLRRSIRRSHARALFAVLIGGAVYGYGISFLPAHLAANGVGLAYLYVPSTIAMLTSRFGAMRQLQALRPRMLVALGLTLSAAGLACAIFAQGAALTIFSGLGLGAGNSLMFPVVAAWVGSTVSPDDRPGVQAWASTSFYFGMYATPYAQAYLVKAWSYVGAEAAIGAISLATAVFLVAPSPYGD